LVKKSTFFTVLQLQSQTKVKHQLKKLNKNALDIVINVVSTYQVAWHLSLYQQPYTDSNV